MLIAGPRAIPLVVVSYQDNVFVVQTLYANKSGVCVTNKEWQELLDAVRAELEKRKE